MLGISDPLRSGVESSVRTLKNAGISVIMITGDALISAVAIAKAAGIVENDFKLSDNSNIAMEGRQFRDLVRNSIIFKGKIYDFS